LASVDVALIPNFTVSGALKRTGVWSPQKVDKMLAELQGGEIQLDSILGLVLSVQILHSLFIEGEIIGDPDFPMMDRSPAANCSLVL